MIMIIMDSKFFLKLVIVCRQFSFVHMTRLATKVFAIAAMHCKVLDMMSFVAIVNRVLEHFT